MADIFISYASDDRTRVRPLAEALQARGFSVWWDRALGAGQDYAAVIESELRMAKAVIVVWTRGSAASTFVRDEAGRARDDGRLVPVLLDRVDIPLGFGAFQAEDFTNWNGAARAPQMQLLEEVLRAKIEGRDVDGGAVERKRRRTATRVRLVSLLSVVALIVVIAVGLNTFFKPQTDVRAELLRLLEEGTLTPDQAIQLAQLLETGALGEASAAAPDDATSGADETQEASPTAVSEAEFDQAARETYNAAMQQLLRHPNEQVRLAARDLSEADKRDAAMQTLWDYARTDAETAPAIYRVCGAVGVANDLPLGRQAAEFATNLAPQDADNWRVLSYSLERAERTDEARAAALVSEGVEAEQQGQGEVAEQKLEQALPSLRAADSRAFVSARLGEYAERRNDWGAATQRYQEAYQERQQATAAAPPAAAEEQSAQVQVDAQRLVRALDRSGRTREACEQLEQAQRAHGVEAPDEAFIERCQTQYRVRVLPGVELRRARRAEALQPDAAEDPAPPQQ